MSIPNIIHFVWTGPPMPLWAKQNMARFRELNPRYKIQLHDESSLWKCFRHAFDRIEPPHLYARRSDLIRLSVILQHGGWYFDSDFVPIRSLDELGEKYSGFPLDCFITHGAYLNNKPWLANGIIAASADCPFMHCLAVEAMRNGEHKEHLGWGDYGPAIYTMLAERHPAMVQIGKLDDFYRLQERAKSMAAAKSIVDSNYDMATILATLGAPAPFMLHASMQDQLEL